MSVASYTDYFWARHAIFLLHVGEEDCVTSPKNDCVGGYDVSDIPVCLRQPMFCHSAQKEPKKIKTRVRSERSENMKRVNARSLRFDQKNSTMMTKRHSFTITAQILARSLANFMVNKRPDTRIYNLCDVATSESRQFDSLLLRKKQMNISFSL